MLRNLIDLDRLTYFWDLSKNYIDTKTVNADTVPTKDSTNLITSGGVYNSLQDKADTEDVPTKLSDLTDDATHRVVTDTEKSTWNGKATTTDITNAINALDVSSVGGSGKYISAISETDGKISATATDMPTIPDSLSDLDDDATHRLVTDTEKSTWNGKADNAPTFTEASTRANITSGETIPTLFGKIKKFFTDLKAVAFSGSYNDLSDKPTIPAAQVNSDWNATSGVAQILNKPTIPAAANNGTLTIQKNGTSVATFTANQSSNVTANITVPTDYIADSQKGAANGVAELDSNGKVPASQLPSYVDDVLEYTNKASFPTTGETGKIYIDKATNRQYRWSGTAYVEISESLALGETSSTAYAGNKGKANADAIAVLNGTGTGSVSKAVSDAISALDVSSVGGSGKYISAISETDGKISATATDFPSIPAAANNGTLTIQKNGTNVQTFTANQSTNATANITVPTKVSELTNDSGYTTNTGTVTSVKVGSTSYNPSSGVVSLPAYPTSLPASDTVSTYSATGTAPVNGTAVAAALGTLDVSSVGGTGKYISAISETDGKISATAANMPTSLPASDVSAWAKASTKPSYNFGEIGAGVATIGNGNANYGIKWRTQDTWLSGVYYNTSGDESVIFANENTRTSWMFAYTDMDTYSAWTTLTPSMQIKNGKVTINKLIPNNEQASYNLDVNGTANATTIYENGTALSSKYAAISAIPTVNNGTLTIQKNGTTVKTFTANSSTNATANITVPTKVSELTNDSGYTTNTGTVTTVKVGTTSYSPTSGVISLPAYPSDTNTHRPIQVNGTQILGNNTTALNLKAGSNVSITNSSGTVTIAATDTTYSSKSAASGGTDVSLCTTGEKYTWNNKLSNFTYNSSTQMISF